MLKILPCLLIKCNVVIFMKENENYYICFPFLRSGHEDRDCSGNEQR